MTDDYSGSATAKGFSASAVVQSMQQKPSSMQCSAVQCSAVQCSAVQHSAVDTGRGGDVICVPLTLS